METGLRQNEGNPPIPSGSLSNEQVWALWYHSARLVCPDYVLTDELLAPTVDLIRWALRIPAPGLDPDKSFCLYGNIGTGKSTLLQVVRKFAGFVRPVTLGRYAGHGEPYTFGIYPAREICDQFADGNYRAIRQFRQYQSIAIDELGSESIPTMHYGTPENVMSYILAARYDRRNELRCTHMTTNLSPADLRHTYGDRIYDRLREMVNFIEFRGPSFRGRK